MFNLDFVIEAGSYLLALMLFGFCIRLLLSPIFSKSPSERAAELLSLLTSYYNGLSERVARKILNGLPSKVGTLKLYDGHPGGFVPSAGLPTEVSRFFGRDTWTLDDVKNYRHTLLS